jgi:hypothetical protein
LTGLKFCDIITAYFKKGNAMKILTIRYENDQTGYAQIIHNTNRETLKSAILKGLSESYSRSGILITDEVLDNLKASNIAALDYGSGYTIEVLRV